MSAKASDAAMGLGAEEGEALWYLGTLMIRKTSTEATKGAFEVIESRADPGVSPPWHIHRHEDESFYVIEGRITYYVGDQVIPAERGAYIWLPRGVPHTFRIEGATTAHLLEIVTPSGLWGFFKEIGEPARELVVPPLKLPDMATLHSVAARYGIEMLGPLNG